MEKNHFPPKSAMLKDRDFEEKILKNRQSPNFGEQCEVLRSFTKIK